MPGLLELVFTSFFLVFTSGITLSAQASSSNSSRACRCLAGASCFPSSSVWNDFNTTVKGSLLQVDPPAYPCYSPESTRQCSEARTDWTNSLWRAEQVGAAQHPNWEAYQTENCRLPRSGESLTRSACHQGAVPVYAVNATRREQVQAAIQFAQQHRLRLVVKNTGHDYNGRSFGRGSLSIWTHAMKNITFHDNFRAQSCDAASGLPAVEVGAGVQWKELYTAADAYKRVLVGALSASVGAAGGYVLGGGHSPLSPTYGLAADNVLQFEMVTPDGTVRTVNRCVNQDLFWALRGGGGSTFGVVTTVVYETHPPVKNVLSVVRVIVANSSQAYRGLIAEFTRLQPDMSGHWAGYFIMSGRMLVMRYLAINRTAGYVTGGGGMTDFFRYVTERPGELQVVLSRITSYGRFLSWYEQELCGFYGRNNCTDEVGLARALGTRLIPSAVMEKSYGQVADALLSLLETNGTTKRILGIFVGGGSTSRQRDNAVNPAWREALWHITSEATWEDSATARQVRAKMATVTSAVAPLRNLTPTSGAYFNEADFNEPDWQQSLFGDSYTRLVEVKRKYDPEGLLVCWHCVGSEEWANEVDC